MKKLFLVLALVGCGKPQPDPAIRDVRPLKLELGEKLLVEASTPIFRVGAPTTLTFDALSMKIPARAVAADRVLADSDENLERLFDGRHVRAATAVTVEQTIDG